MSGSSVATEQSAGSAPLLAIENLSVEFQLGSLMMARLRGKAAPVVHAVNGVTLDVPRGSALGIVGESGCGKSTLARAIVGLERASGGSIRFDNIELPAVRPIELRRRIQMVFQDPSTALNPLMSVERTLRELLGLRGTVDRAAQDQRCEELMELVDLPVDVLKRRPTELSGGQRQRVSIARALTMEPDLLIADESVAALDVSVQASILNLFQDLRERLGLTLILISHDLSVIRQTCDDVAVMYLGEVVEQRLTGELISDPLHPYSKALITAAPRFGSRKTPGLSVLPGEPPSPMSTRQGCAFVSRCPEAVERCHTEAPALTPKSGAASVACHLAI